MRQTAFFFNTEDAYNLNEFIVSRSNILAHDLISSWPKTWGVNPYPNILILAGPKSSGKTFLAKKWASKSGALFINKSDQLNEDILKSHHAFVIENLSHDWDEIKMFHFFNASYESGKYLLITTKQIPDILLPDLKSRLASVNIININMPDDELIEILIFKFFSHYSIVISAEIISFLIKILPRDCAEIIKSVKIINDYALTHKHKITIPLIKKALGLIDPR